MSTSENPPYPVISATPSVNLILANLYPSETLGILAFTAAGFPIGFAIGKPTRKLNAWFMTANMFVISLLGFSQRSYFRLTGWAENSKDMRRYTE